MKTASRTAQVREALEKKRNGRFDGGELRDGTGTILPQCKKKFRIRPVIILCIL